MTPFWEPLRNGMAVAVRVRVQPKSRRPGLHGVVVALNEQRLRIGVTEPAEGGRANSAACAALAAVLGVAPSAVHVAIGATSREKTMHVGGDPAVLGARLASL